MNMETNFLPGRALQVTEVSKGGDSLAIDQIEIDPPAIGPGQVLVEVVAAGVNPSDVKATLGNMPHAVWPRIPGRDFAGIVRGGPKALVGKEIWGGGGELGITQDGTHARWLVLHQSAVCEKPSNLDFLQAGSIGVPFLTAFEGLREAGGVQPWHNVVVFGANGKVGQAAIQIAALCGAKVFGVEHKPGDFVGHASREITMIDHSSSDVAEEVRAATGGKGADIIFNTVGSPYFEVASRTLGKLGKQIFISTFERAVDFDIFQFYRGRQRYIGIDTLALDSIYCAKIFDALKLLFEDGRLQPFPISSDAVFGLDQAVEAYQRVLNSSPDRILLKP